MGELLHRLLFSACACRYKKNRISFTDMTGNVQPQKTPVFPGLVFALNLDGRGAATEIPASRIRTELNEGTTTWVHLDYSATGVREWLEEVAGLDEVIVTALMAEEPRPRCVQHRNGMFMILRGVNLNPGADREDMVSLRLWIGPNGLISMRQRRLKAAAQIREALEAGLGPMDHGELIVALNDRMCQFMADVVQDLEEKIDNLEERVMTMERDDLRAQLSDVRRETIAIRRYLAPQRDALNALLTTRVAWLTELISMRMREVMDRTIRYIEDLDVIRERAQVTQEELNNRIAERMNRTMYFLSLVAGVFLPLGLVTGLLGINVGGVPGTDQPSAFWVVCGLLAATAFVQLIVLKRMGWL